ncbi:glycoside hydrolase family 88 protein [uncultured Akkermansia sp.]|uniref:glycoside hydrolase family 88 protein n=1 Tax=uncultured Akkermansia sp. TaxID=512294 RepID=UPI00265CFC64|nr:glycoside hydrolase family 88 protein [uncultured Akkermansia sp.]
MTAYVSILSVLLLLALAVVCVDAWRFAGTLAGRFHIGRWEDRHAWQEALARTAVSWTRRMPAIPKRDQGRRILWEMVRGAYADAAIQGWQAAGLFLGLHAYAEDRNDGVLKEKLFRDLEEHTLVKSFLAVPAPERWEVDRLLLDYAVLEAGGRRAEQVAEASAALLESLRTEAGTLAYRRRQPGVRYVDTIGLACPLAAACAARTGNGEYWDLAVKQVEEYDAALLPHSSFPAHGFEMERGYPLGLYDWSRGIGWYALGLCELYRQLSLHGRPEADRMARRILALAEELLPLQKKKGGFGWMVARPESVFESSGTALMGLLMLTAFRISGEKRFLDAAFRVEKALMGVTRRSGVLDMCQGDTKGIGMYSDVWNLMPFAQGMALRLSVELNREEGKA